MTPIAASASTLAVTAIFVVWQHYRQLLDRRERTLRTRVAYMLWCAANREE